MSTYSNLGIELIATGDQAGAWGNTTNSNFSGIIDAAIVGFAQILLPAAGSAAAPNTLPVAQGPSAVTTSTGQKRIIEAYSVADLGIDAFLQITPNNFVGYYFIRNSLTNDRNLKVFQGTWNGSDANRAITVQNGCDAIIRCSGSGVSAVVTLINNRPQSGPLYVNNAATIGSVITGASTDNALRITQTGSGNALLVEDSANPDSSPFLIDADGRVVSGYTAPRTTLGGATYRMQSLVSGADWPLLVGYTGTSASSSASLSIIRNKAASDWGVNTSVANNDALGLIQWFGATGSDYKPAASISAFVDGSSFGGAASIQGRIIFSTQSNGASVLAERMRITSAGNVGIGNNAPTEKLDVTGNVLASGSGVFLGNVGANRSAVSSVGLAAAAPGTTSSFYAFYAYDSASTSIFYVRGDGALVTNGAKAESPANSTGATSPSPANVVIGVSGGNSQFLRSTSSIRYKQNVEDLTHGLSAVMQLRPVTYRGIREPGKVWGGFIAEEIDALGLSEFVVYNDEDVPDGLAYGNMTALLAKAIQEQQAMIEDLKARVAALGG
jgi:hypothetical protein